MTNREKLNACFNDTLEHVFTSEKMDVMKFRALDALPLSICAYDAEGRLFYGNLEYCNYVQIQNREEAYGKRLEDILEETGVQIISPTVQDGHWRLYDVIKYGEPILGWEVEVIYPFSPEDRLIATNDMYPIFDENKAVLGIVEVCKLRKKQIRELRDVLGLSATCTFESFVGGSKLMEEAKSRAKTFAKTPYNVLIYGESGVGKEMFAQSIHNHSDRSCGPFVAINCASIPTELIDSELFGYEGGAFTGASKKGQVGKFELADGGTLFLDEVAELPPNFQTRLLRALETHQITRVGGAKTIPVDVRVIAATNQPIEKMIEEGLFRSDLYYRLMVLNVEIPPLRHRPEDILPCAEYFLERTQEESNFFGEKKVLDESARKMLLAYDWPGNVRELRNVMNRAYVCATSANITEKDIRASLRLKADAPADLSAAKSPEARMLERKQAIEEANMAWIQEALDIAEGNKIKAAELMGISRRTLYRMLESYEIL